MLNAHIKDIHMVIAVDTEGGYAKDGTIPWNIPEDMERFKTITNNGVCIMGRNTYEDMVKMREAKGATITDEDGVLPGRTCFVVTSDRKYKPVGATSARGITDAIRQLKNNDVRNIFVIGGHRLFVEALGRLATVYMSIIKGDPYKCDTFFPYHVLNTNYDLISGDETELCYNVVYQPKPIALMESEQENWERFIRENFRPA